MVGLGKLVRNLVANIKGQNRYNHDSRIIEAYYLRKQLLTPMDDDFLENLEEAKRRRSAYEKGGAGISDYPMIEA